MYVLRQLGLAKGVGGGTQCCRGGLGVALQVLVITCVSHVSVLVEENMCVGCLGCTIFSEPSMTLAIRRSSLGVSPVVALTRYELVET